MPTTEERIEWLESLLRDCPVGLDASTAAQLADWLVHRGAVVPRTATAACMLAEARPLRVTDLRPEQQAEIARRQLPEGYLAVPREPTKAIVYAMLEACRPEDYDDGKELLRAMWRAAIACAEQKN